MKISYFKNLTVTFWNLKFEKSLKLFSNKNISVFHDSNCPNKHLYRLFLIIVINFISNQNTSASSTTDDSYTLNSYEIELRLVIRVENTSILMFSRKMCKHKHKWAKKTDRLSSKEEIFKISVKMIRISKRGDLVTLFS